MKLEALKRTSTGQWLVIAAITLPLFNFMFPHVAYAQGTSELDTPTFEIKIDSDRIARFISTQGFITLESDENLETVTSQIETDPLALRKELLRKYFTEVRPSRLVDYVDVLAEQEQWRKITAIAFVESTMCKNHDYNNCWGITYSKGLAKYPTLKEGIVDTNRVLMKSYASKTYEQMNGIYVQPKNPRWVRGANQIELELDKHVEPRNNQNNQLAKAN